MKLTKGLKIVVLTLGVGQVIHTYHMHLLLLNKQMLRKEDLELLRLARSGQYQI